MSQQEQGIYEFSDFQLNVGKGILLREGQPVSMQWKTFETLCIFVKSNGHLFSRDELMDKLWADTFVEENNLSQHISALRKALGENRNGTKFIETVAGRGYRFVAEVKEISAPETSVRTNSNNGNVEAREFFLNGSSAIDNFKETNLKNESRIRHKLTSQTKINRFWLSILAAGIILTTAFSIYLYNRNSNKAAIQPIKSIAVLPLKSLSLNADNEELRLRITDALITKLGGLKGVATRPTDSVLRFSKSEQSIFDIGKKLEVDAVLDGRIQQEGENVRVTLQLVSVAGGEQIWSEQFDGKTNQILNLQDAISAKVLQTLNQDRQQRLEFAARPTENAEAYEGFLRARYFATRSDEKNLLKAIDYYKQAIELDPQFAESYAGMADMQFRLYVNKKVHNPEALVQAKENIQKALAIKPDSAFVLNILAFNRMVVDWDWENAEKTFKRAIEIEPDSAFVRMRYGILLNNLRRFEEAQTELEQAVKLNPTSASTITNLGLVYFCKKDFARAEQQFRKALEFDEKWIHVHWFLSRCLWMQGKKEESIKYVVNGLNAQGSEPLARKIEEKARISEPDDVIRFLINEWSSNPNKKDYISLANREMSLGEREKALLWLEKSFEEHQPATISISALPDFEPLRNEPRFQELLRKMNPK